MKNLHLISTDKYSPLAYSTNGGGHLFKSEHYSPMKEMGDSYKNIYITSDEEIKVGDWVYCNIEGFEPVLKQKVNPMEVNNNLLMKKIIVTTDQSLDGIQSIDDEFLEWFVKNSSCEEVQVVTDRVFRFDEFHQREFFNRHKIIIPKEEPKLNLSLLESKLDKALSKETEESLTDWVNGKRTKQETLEERAARYDNIKFPIPYGYVGAANDFINGYQLAQERMYSEEEVLDILDKFLTSMVKGEKTGLIEQWFNQFKKK